MQIRKKQNMLTNADWIQNIAHLYIVALATQSYFSKYRMMIMS